MTGMPPWANIQDWKQVLTAAEEQEVSWLIWPFVEAGTLTSVYTDPKEGKSLFMQVVSAQLAVSGHIVLYLDYENPVQVFGERFLDTGYTAEQLTGRLFYSSFPATKPFDTPEGAASVVEIVNAAWKPDLIVVDTLSKTFEGAENSADTFGDIYRHTLLPMRRAGLTVVLLDHSGKDPTRGQRGSSAKPSDVDVVWNMTTAKGQGDLVESARLFPTHSRANHVEPFTAACLQNPLRFEISQTQMTSRQAELAGRLDQMGLPRTSSRKECRQALAAAGIKCRNADLGAAIRYRKATGRDGTAPVPEPRDSTGQMASDLRGQDGDNRGQTGDNSHPLGGTVPVRPGHDRIEWERMARQAHAPEGRRG